MFDPKAFAKAQARLKLAAKNLDAVANCSEYETFTEAWYMYLVAAKNVYSQMEQAAKATPQARQWFGRKKQDRKNDPLLQYLFQARNDDEHGIESVTEYDPGGIAVGVNRPGYSQSLQIDSLTFEQGRIIMKEAQSLDGKPILIERHAPSARLITVTALDGTKYPPPTQHLGTPLTDTSPVTVGRLGLNYLTALLEEAWDFGKP